MKRQTTSLKIENYFPLTSWTQCDECQEDYLFEFMWYITYRNKRKIIRNIFCKNCYVTKKEIKRRRVENGIYNFNRYTIAEKSN